MLESTPTGSDQYINDVASHQSLTQTPLRKFFEAAVKHEASDLFLCAGQVPRLRIHGSLKPLDTALLDFEGFEKMVRTTLTARQCQAFDQQGSFDMGVDLNLENGQIHRFRINVFRTRGRYAIAARRVNDGILNFNQLHLPPCMERIAQMPQGLVLVAGVSDSGKSTTIASTLQYINENRPCHIVTIEDPIEYLFTNEKAMIHQREVGVDVSSFEVGLRALVRENPDVVLIGEMRDKATFEAALQAAEIGQLVFGTIHAPSLPQTFSRIYNLFDADEHQTIRNMLAYQMQAIIYQKLLPTIHEDLHRIPVTEVLLQSPSARKFILDGREHEIDIVIKNERQAGMHSFTDSLIDLVEQEFIHPRVAQAAATNPVEVKMRLKGINSG